MRKWIWISALLLASCEEMIVYEKEDTTVACKREDASLTLEIEGYVSAACDPPVRKALAGLSGITSIETKQTEADKGVAAITYEADRVTPKEMCAAIDSCLPPFSATVLNTMDDDPHFITFLGVVGYWSDACAAPLQAALLKMKGVVKVNARHVSRKYGEVTVTYRQGEVTEGELRNAINATRVKFKTSVSK